MTETQLRVLIWDICCNHPLLRHMTTRMVGSIQDMAVEYAKRLLIIEEGK